MHPITKCKLDLSKKTIQDIYKEAENGIVPEKYIEIDEVILTVDNTRKLSNILNSLRRKGFTSTDFKNIEMELYGGGWRDDHTAEFHYRFQVENEYYETHMKEYERYKVNKAKSDEQAQLEAEKKNRLEEEAKKSKLGCRMLRLQKTIKDLRASKSNEPLLKFLETEEIKLRALLNM